MVQYGFASYVCLVTTKNGPNMWFSFVVKYTRKPQVFLGYVRLSHKRPQYSACITSYAFTTACFIHDAPVSHVHFENMEDACSNLISISEYNILFSFNFLL